MALALYKANAIHIGEKSNSRYLQYFSIREYHFFDRGSASDDCSVSVD